MGYTRFNHLNVPDQWRQYWTKYPEGYTILEALLNWVRQVDELIDNVNGWNEYLKEFVEQFDEKLQDTVVNILIKWKEDGTLEDLIYEAFDNIKKDLEGRGVNLQMYEHLVVDGDWSPAFNQIATEFKGELGGTVHIPEGTYTYYSHILFENMERLTFKGNGNAILVDGCKDITANDMSIRKVPVGFETKNVTKVIFDGVKTTNLVPNRATSIEGSERYNRVPQFDFYNCEDVVLKDVRSSGLVGTPVGGGLDIGASFVMRSSYFRFDTCGRVTLDNSGLADNGGDGEIYGFYKCKLIDNSKMYHRKGSNNNTFWSIAKVIDCESVVVKQMDIESTIDTSLMDVAGKNYTIKDCHVDYSKGKFLDITAEWGASNPDSDNITVEDCSTNGFGIFNSANHDNVVPKIDTVNIKNFKQAISTNEAQATRYWGLWLPYTLNVIAENLVFHNVRDIVYNYYELATQPLNFGRRIEINGIRVTADTAINTATFGLDAHGDLIIRRGYFDGNNQNNVSFSDRYAQRNNLSLKASPYTIVVEDTEFRHCDIYLGARVRFVRCKFYNVTFREESSRTAPNPIFEECRFQFIDGENSRSSTGNIFVLTTSDHVIFRRCIIYGRTYNTNARPLFNLIKDNNRKLECINCEFDLLRVNNPSETQPYTILGVDITTDVFNHVYDDCKFSPNTYALRGTDAVTNAGSFVQLTYSSCQFQNAQSTQFRSGVDGIDITLVSNIFKGGVNYTNLDEILALQANFNKCVMSANVSN